MMYASATLVLSLLTFTFASSSSRSLLIVAEPDLVREDYSLFWRSLQDRGFELHYRSALDATPKLHELGEPSFDNVLLFAPTSKSFPADLSPQNLVGYVAQGRNLLVVLSPDLSEFWRDFSREFEIEFDERGSRATDHFHFDQALDDGTHSTLVIPLDTLPLPFASPATQRGPPLLYRGISHSSSRNPLLFTSLRAPASAYSRTANKEGNDPHCSSIALVTSMQAKNNARISFIGSVDLFSDAFTLAPVSGVDGSRSQVSGNAAFIRDLTRWTFQESGLLRVDGIRHARAVDGLSLPLYRVRDELIYEIDIVEWSDEKWAPHRGEDLQLEFSLVDPHLRLPLTSGNGASGPNSSTLSARFQAPDKHGVFTLRVDYRRSGWSYIDERTVVSITPPRHDEYERFIGGALPYYAGAFSVTLGAVAFILVWTLQ